MKKIISTMLLWTISYIVHGQIILEGVCNTPVTNQPCFESSPNIITVPTNSYPAPALGCFDWTLGYYRVSLKKGGNSQCLDEYINHKEIRSPFYPNNCSVTDNRPTVGQQNTQNFWFVPEFQITGSSENNREDRDMYPSQGWVLLFEAMGRWAHKTTGEKDDQLAVTNPTFVLYNKYTGVIRVFIYDHCKSSKNNGVEIKLILANTSTKKATRIFDDLNPTSKGLNSAVKALGSVNNITNVLVDDATWYVADFMTSYDPCLENQTSGLDLIVDFKRLETLEVNLKVNGNIVTEQHSESSRPSEGSLLSSFDYNGIGAATISAYKEFDGYKKMLTEYIEKLHPSNKNDLATAYDKTVEGQLSLIPGTLSSDLKFTLAMKNIAGKPEKLEKSTTMLLGLANVLPYAGTAIGLYKYFSSGSSSEKSSPTVSTVNLEINGTIVEPENSQNISIKLPGTSQLKGYGISDYNKTLGLFRLLKDPVLKSYTYKIRNIDGNIENAFDSRFDNYNSKINNSNYFEVERGIVLSDLWTQYHYNNYSILQYQLDEPIKILVNELSTDLDDANIEVLSAEAAYVLEYDKKYVNDLDKHNYILSRGMFPVLPNSPVVRNVKFSDICNNLGWYVESKTENIEERSLASDYDALRIRTKYIPINLFERKSFFLSFPMVREINFWDGSTPKLEMKLVISYRPKDPNYTGPNLLFIRSYPLDLTIKDAVSDFNGTFDYEIANPIVNELESPSNSYSRLREFLFTNTRITNASYNNFSPNFLVSKIRDESDVINLIINNPYQIYFEGNTLDFEGTDSPYSPNNEYKNLSDRLLYMDGNYARVVPNGKNWNNVIIASTGEKLQFATFGSSPDYGLPGNFTGCGFNNTNRISIEGWGDEGLITFNRCEFVASKNIFISGNVKLEAGTVMGISTNPIFKSTPQQYLNNNIATRDEINSVCNSQGYQDAVKVLSVNPSVSLPKTDSLGFKNKIEPKAYQVFPNPAKNTVTIQSPNSDEVISKVVIKNILGVEVASFIIKNPASEVSIDVSGVPIGIYKLSVNNFSTTLGIQR